MAPHITAKLERDASMPRCRNLSAFFGKRCVADHTEDPISVKPSQKQQKRRAICSKDGASAASSTFAPQKSILKLLAEPISKNDPSAQSIGYALALIQYEGVKTEEETLKATRPCEESASLLAEVSLNLLKQMDSAQNSETKCLHLINNKVTEEDCAHKHSGVPKSMENSELQNCDVMEGGDTEICMGGKKACPLELGESQEQAAISSFQHIKNSSAIEQKLSFEQSSLDWDTEAPEVRIFEHHSVKCYIDQQLTQLCKEHQLSELSVHSPLNEESLEVKPDALNACHDGCGNFEEPRTVVCATLVQGDGSKTVNNKMHASESAAGAAQVNTTAPATEEQQLGCTKDRQEGKSIEVERRRSSRIKKLVKSGEEGIKLSSSCMDQEVPKLAVPNSAHKIWDNDCTATQSDFFLPASKRSKNQKRSEEINTLVSNGEKRQRDGKLGQLQKGNSVNVSKQGSNTEDFFVPASKKQKQMLNTLDPIMKEEQEEKTSLFQFDLWTEAKLAAEENAQLCVGKPTHPFFSQHRSGQRASVSLGISANACSSHQASCPEEMELAPSPPFHVTQLIEAEVGTTDMQSWTSSWFLQNLKVDQTSLRAECCELTSKELDGILRVPTVDKLSMTARRNLAWQGVLLDDVLEPVLSFLKDSESVSKKLNTMEEEEFYFSSVYLKERLKAFSSDRAKRWSYDSCNMSSMDEGSATKNSLWTSVYQPQSPKEVCGNRESVNRLSAWLERWQAGSAMTTSSSEGALIRRKMSNYERSDEDQGCFQEDSNSEDEARADAALQNVLFLAGPVGCGKTAAIYACARVHGYTVIEVNCSDNRNGLLIKQKFSESMESHRVGKWSADTTGPGNATFFTKQGASTAADSNMATSSHTIELTNTQLESKEKRQQQKQKRKNDDTTQASKVANRAAPNTDVGLALEAKKLDESIECDPSMTVLLFEDVDMVFEDDRGFMAAVAQVAATAKRPIILTSNDKRLCLPQSLGAELLEFQRPSAKELVVLAYLICLAEGVPCRPEFLLQMVKLCHQDLRILLNYLQFWSQGHANESLLEIKNQITVAKIEREVGMHLCLRSEEAECASVSKLFKLEAQHRLWPSFVSLGFSCQVTQIVACKLNDKVSQVEKKFDIEEEKKLENHIAEKVALLKKLKRRKVDSPLKGHREEVNSACAISTAELSEDLETPVKNLKEVKAVARSPILREKLKKDLAATMLGCTDDSECKEECDNQAVLQTSGKQDSLESGKHFEHLNAHLQGTSDSNVAISVTAINIVKTADDAHIAKESKVCREAYINTADVEVGSVPPTELTKKSNQLLTLEDRPPMELRSDSGESMLQSISEPIYTMWSEFRNMKEKQGLILSSASKEFYRATVCLSKLSDNLSSCDVMSCVHGPGKMSLENDIHFWESLEDSSMLQACSMFAHKSLLLCVEECSTIPNLPEEIRPTVSTEHMMLAVNDSCAVGKLFMHNGVLSSEGFQLQTVATSHQEQESERYRKKSSLQRALYSELPSKAQVSFHGASFYEYASFLARIGHLEQDRLTCGAVRRRGRGFQNYFRSHPWNLSKESINILEQFGRFSTS